MRIIIGFLALLMPAMALAQNVPPGGYPGPNPNLSTTTGIFRLGTRIMAFGDDNAAQSAVNAYNNNGLSGGAQEIQISGNGDIGWINKFLGQTLDFEPALGYGPIQYQGGVEKVQITSGGNYSVAPTGASLTGCGTTTLGTPVMAGTAVSYIPVTAETGACPTGSALVLTGGTGTTATGYALSGNGGSISAIGATTTQMLAMLPDVLNLPVDIVLVEGGTNGILAGTETVSQSIANLQSMFQQIQASGKTAIYVSPIPRSPVAGVPNTSGLKQFSQMAQWAKWYAQGINTIRPTGYGNFLYVDREPDCGDNANSGQYLANCTTASNGFTESGGGAYVTGYRAAQQLAQLLGIYPPAINWSANGQQAYGITDFPGGILPGSSWFNTVTGGAAISPVTGTCPNGWTCQRYFGSGTGTVGTGSSETTRSDLRSGSRYQITSSLGSGAGTTQMAITQVQTVSALGITAGTTPIVGFGSVEVSNETNLRYLDLAVQCENSGSTTIAQAEDMGGEYTDGSVIPSSTQLYGPTTALQMAFKTPPIVCPAATTQVQFSMLWAYLDSGAVASATGTLKFTAFQLGIKQ